MCWPIVCPSMPGDRMIASRWACLSRDLIPLRDSIRGRSDDTNRVTLQPIDSHSGSLETPTSPILDPDCFSRASAGRRRSDVRGGRRAQADRSGIRLAAFGALACLLTAVHWLGTRRHHHGTFVRPAWHGQACAARRAFDRCWGDLRQPDYCGMAAPPDIRCSDRLYRCRNQPTRDFHLGGARYDTVRKCPGLHHLVTHLHCLHEG